MNTLQAYESISPINEYTKEKIIQLADAQSGEIISAGSAEISWAFLSKLELLVKETKSRILDNAMAEIEKGNNHAFGVKMAVTPKTTYNFDNDQICVNLELKLKQRKDFLKKVKEPFNELDESTGEIIKILPPNKETTYSIRNTF